MKLSHLYNTNFLLKQPYTYNYLDENGNSNLRLRRTMRYEFGYYLFRIPKGIDYASEIKLSRRQRR